MKSRTLTFFALLVVFHQPSSAGVWDFFSGLLSDSETAEEQDERQSEDLVEPPTQRVSGSLRSGVTRLNVREAPSLRARVITQIDAGEGFEILSRPNAWTLIELEGQPAWIERGSLSENAGFVRQDVSNLNFREGPGPRDRVLLRLQGGREFAVLGRNGDRVHIQLEDGQQGYVHSRYIEESLQIEEETQALQYPVNGDVLGVLNAGASIDLLENPDFTQIRLPEGRIGWIASSFLSSEPQAAPSEATDEPWDTEQIPQLVSRLHHELKVVLMLAEGNFLMSGVMTPFTVQRGSQGDILESLPIEDLEAREYVSLVKMLNSYPALLECGGYAWNRQYTEAAACAEETAFILRSEEAPENLESEARIYINIPAERLRVYDRFGRLNDFRVVIGHPEHSDNEEGDNSKTRVGDFEIASWHQYYSNRDYPAWDEEPLQAAFGKWTAKLNDQNYQYIHGTYGYGVIDWAAIRLAPGSHGCIRCRNDDIEWLNSQADVGTTVKKFYVTREIRNDGYRIVLDEPDNIYEYEDVESNGFFYPGSGILVDYQDPEDAVTDET